MSDQEGCGRCYGFGVVYASSAEGGSDSIPVFCDCPVGESRKKQAEEPVVLSRFCPTSCPGNQRSRTLLAVVAGTLLGSLMFWLVLRCI